MINVNSNIELILINIKKHEKAIEAIDKKIEETLLDFAKNYYKSKKSLPPGSSGLSIAVARFFTDYDKEKVDFEYFHPQLYKLEHDKSEHQNQIKSLKANLRVVGK
jgi:hypothetical protein